MYLLEDCSHKVIVKFHLITHQIPHYVSTRLRNFTVDIVIISNNIDDAISSWSSWVFNIFRSQSDGSKRYLCILLDAFVMIGAWEGPITDRRTSARRYTRDRTCHNEGMNLMNDYRDAAFLWIIFPATKCRCRAYKIYLSSCTLIFRPCQYFRSLTCTRTYFSAASYTLSRTVFEDMIYQTTQYMVLGSVVLRNVVCDRRYYHTRRSYESNESNIVRWYISIPAWDNGACNTLSTLKTIYHMRSMRSNHLSASKTYSSIYWIMCIINVKC